MNEQELLASLQAEIKNRFMQLTDNEKDIIRSGSNTEYAILLRRVMGEKVLGSLKTAAPVKKTGLGAR
jgi:hypothetical protein